MTDAVEQKTILIAMVKDGDRILMRKKPAGSPPYKETWYLFGCESKPGQEDAITIANYLKKVLKIDVFPVVPIGEDSEVKQDNDGITKCFTYKDFECTYQSGTPEPMKEVECVEWIPKDMLSRYDIVPPSVKLFKKLHIL